MAEARGVTDSGSSPQFALQPHTLDILVQGSSHVVPDKRAEAKAYRREKGVRPMVSPLHLTTMVSAYNHHFALYSRGRNRVNQLIPSVVWKAIYAHYLKQFPDSVFQEESLKDRLRDRLKELSRVAPNEENSRTGLLPREEGDFVQLNGSATKNNPVKRRKVEGGDPDSSSGTTRSIDIALSPLPNHHSPIPNLTPNCNFAPSNPSPACDFAANNPIPNPSPDAVAPPPPATTITTTTTTTTTTATTNPSPSLNPNPNNASPNPSPNSVSTPTERIFKSKSQMLMELSTSIALMARSFEASSEKREALLAAKLHTEEEKRKKAKISNLKNARDLDVISAEEFKQQVKEILNL